mgnify:CR=1 FL=1
MCKYFLCIKNILYIYTHVCTYVYTHVYTYVYAYV